MQEAERIKIKYGSAQGQLLDKDETIEVPSVGGRAPRVLSRRILCEIVEPRVEELFQLVQREIQKAGQEDLLASGVVLTGGSTLLHGMPELAEEVLGLPVRRGVPRNVGGLVDVVKSPQHATAVGLLHYGVKQDKDGRAFVGDASSLRERFLGWVKELF
jgi:cell division protein FtsA